MKGSTRNYRDNVSVARDRYADLITESMDVKKLVRERLDQFGVSLWKFCQEYSLPYHRIKYWMNTTNPKTVRGVVAQSDIIKLCENLGVNIRLTLVVQKEFEVDDNIKYAQRKSVRKGYKNNAYKAVRDYERQQREKKRTPPGSEEADRGADSDG